MHCVSGDRSLAAGHPVCAVKGVAIEGSILRYVFLHSIVLAGLVGVLVTLQAYVYPFTMLVLK